MAELGPGHEAKLSAFAHRLLDAGTARVAVEPMRGGPGHWFGGGNVIEGSDGSWYLSGRYRNHGDSRTGLGAGERGIELAIWQSDDRGQHWNKQLSWHKQALAVGAREVVSIEGSTLVSSSDGIELFVSSEKTGIDYGHGLASYLKPGTGVWTIERLAASSVDALRDAEPTTVLECEDPRYVHVKDPFAYRMRDGSLALLFCTHPFCWSSSNTAYALRRRDDCPLEAAVYDFFPRGTTWDVAITRATALLDVPPIGAFSAMEVTLVFYDGGESIHCLDDDPRKQGKPRGYSCEELGGLGYFTGVDLHDIQRISRYFPEFVSSEGTGCRRYVDVARVNGGYLATWQQSRGDSAQPLLSNFVTDAEVEVLLG